MVGHTVQIFENFLKIHFYENLLHEVEVFEYVDCANYDEYGSCTYILICGIINIS